MLHDFGCKSKACFVCMIFLSYIYYWSSGLYQLQKTSGIGSKNRMGQCLGYLFWDVPKVSESSLDLLSWPTVLPSQLSCKWSLPDSLRAPRTLLADFTSSSAGLRLEALRPTPKRHITSTCHKPRGHESRVTPKLSKTYIRKRNNKCNNGAHTIGQSLLD